MRTVTLERHIEFAMECHLNSFFTTALSPSESIQDVFTTIAAEFYPEIDVDEQKRIAIETFETNVTTTTVKPEGEKEGRCQIM
jgi:hypothetical protein